MTNAEDYRYILLDAVERLREEAEAIQGSAPYDEGRQMAYYEVLSGILSAAETVGLSAADVGMADFEPGHLVGIASARQAA
jgi:hypothetical protein